MELSSSDFKLVINLMQVSETSKRTISKFCCVKNLDLSEFHVFVGIAKQFYLLITVTHVNENF